jgi:hypothetical protein
MTRISFKNYTLSDSSWTEVDAPISCSYFFMHVIGTKLPFIIASDTVDQTQQDVVEANWTIQIPSWAQSGVRWLSGSPMFFLQASAGNSGMKVGITFVL